MKVKVKTSRHWKNYRNCHLGISLNNPNLAGSSLEAIVAWINVQHFAEAFIDLSDTLHRHNIALSQGLDEAAAHREALAEGDRWLRENYRILKQLNIPFRMVRWDYWLKIDGVIENYEFFSQAFIEDEGFRDSICRDVHGFTCRNGLALDREQLAFGARYLLEELAVLSFYFDGYPCAKLYPGKEQHSFRYVREGKLKNAPPALRNVFYTPLWLCREPERASDAAIGHGAAAA